MSESKTIALPLSDGIGPEITASVVKALETLVPGRLRFEEHLFGGHSLDAHGTPLTDEVLAACRAGDGILLAVVGGRTGRPQTQTVLGLS